jgi:hypothetical protein
MSSKYLRGAFVQMTQSFGSTTPNVIIFQYNPESLTHGWSPAEADQQHWQGANPLAVRGLPTETFSFTLVMDANDAIGLLDPVAISSGIYTRLSALEMLLFPTVGDQQSASLAALATERDSTSTSSDGSQQSQTVPAGELPIVLFVWGGARIVPVRVSNLNITETLYDALLNPTHAEATVSLQVLTKQDLANATGPLAAVARDTYDYTHGARQSFALANLANAADASIGFLPFL